MESLAKQHRGPASFTKAAAGEPQVLQYGINSLTKTDLVCGCCEKRSRSMDRASLAAHPLPARTNGAQSLRTKLSMAHWMKSQ